MKLLLKSFSILLLVNLCFTACHHKRDYKAEAEKFHKQRPASPLIKALNSYVTITDSEHLKPVELPLQQESYDSKGRKTKVIHYNDSGKADYITNLSYDARGNAVKTHTVYYFPNSESTEVSTYDNDNHVIKTEWRRSDGSSGRNEFLYDKYGKMDRMDSYEKGAFIKTRLYEFIYDDDGRPEESFYKETSNGHDTVTQGHYRYVYDSITGLESGNFVLYGDATLELVQSQYDKNRNKIMEFHYLPDSSGKINLKTRILNVYNEYGEITETNIYNEVKLQSSVKNTYDKYGHLTESVTTEGNMTKRVRYEYSFQ